MAGIYKEIINIFQADQASDGLATLCIGGIRRGWARAKTARPHCSLITVTETHDYSGMKGTEAPYLTTYRLQFSIIGDTGDAVEAVQDRLFEIFKRRTFMGITPAEGTVVDGAETSRRIMQESDDTFHGISEYMVEIEKTNNLN